jgi:hypothetical protein
MQPVQKQTTGQRAVVFPVDNGQSMRSIYFRSGGAANLVAAVMGAGIFG